MMSAVEMDLKETLKNAGLSDKEASVYLASLELGEATPAQIAEKAGVKRPTTYVVLDQLKKKDLITTRPDRKSELFRAITPYAILKNQREVYSSLELALPELLNLNNSYRRAPKMEVYLGVEGIRKMWEEMLKSSTDVLFWADERLTTYVENGGERSVFGGRPYASQYTQERVKKGILIQGIAPYEADKSALDMLGLKDAQDVFLKWKERGREELRELRFIPRSKHTFKSEITIFDDKVVITSYYDLVGAILQNEYFADTQRSIFNLAFEYAGGIEDKTFKETNSYSRETENAISCS